MSISYLADVDTLFVHFESRAGYYDSISDDDRVQIRYDRDGRAIGFMVEGLTTEKCAQYGIEAFVGMISETHYNCSHFWCTPTPDGMDLNVKARMYYAVNPEEDTDFIGVHLFNPVKTIGDGIVFSDVPVQKLVIQPTCDGRLGILMGMDHSTGHR